MAGLGIRPVDLVSDLDGVRWKFCSIVTEKGLPGFAGPDADCQDEVEGWCDVVHVIELRLVVDSTLR